MRRLLPEGPACRQASGRGESENRLRENRGEANELLPLLKSIANTPRFENQALTAAAAATVRWPLLAWLGEFRPFAPIPPFQEIRESGLIGPPARTPAPAPPLKRRASLLLPFSTTTILPSPFSSHPLAAARSRKMASIPLNQTADGVRPSPPLPSLFAQHPPLLTRPPLAPRPKTEHCAAQLA